MLWSSSSQKNTFWHKWKPHVTITLMIIHFFTWALWLGYRRMNVILERKQSHTPEIYWCSTFHQSRKFVANKRKKIHLLYCGLSGHSLYISWANIFHLGISLLKGMQLSWWIIMHLNSCFSFRFHRITIINVAPIHNILLPGTPVQLKAHKQWQFLSFWQHSKACNAIHQSLPFCCHLNGLFSKFPRHLGHCLLFILFVN